MKTGLILEGGGLRGAFSAGVLDVFIKEGIHFDYACGVSAGAGVLCNYISGQESRSLNVLLCPRGESYYGKREFFRSGKYMNLDKLYGEMVYMDPAFDFDAFFANPMEVEVVATNCMTGKAEYLTHNKTAESLCNICKATSSLPFISGPYKIGDNYYMDGSVSDPLPFMHAFEKDCDKVVIISTKGDGMNPSNLKKFTPFMRIKYHKFKGFVDAVQVRIPLLMGQYELADEKVKEGTVMLYHPEGKWDISHMEKDINKLHDLYNEGIRYANECLDSLREFIGAD